MEDNYIDVQLSPSILTSPLNTPINKPGRSKHFENYSQEFDADIPSYQPPKENGSGKHSAAVKSNKRSVKPTRHFRLRKKNPDDGGFHQETKKTFRKKDLF